MSKGVKFDGGKARYELLPPEGLEALAKVLTFGASKYGDRNWEQGMSWSRVFGAMMRHSWALMCGERIDPESNFPHTWHIAANAIFLVTYEDRKIGEDDLPKQKGE